jgi:hypothetical protein
MPLYRIHRMRDHVRQSFRHAAHTLGEASVKQRDFVPEENYVEAVSPYAAWEQLQGTDGAMQVGDMLESESGVLSLCKYVGFADATWVVPERSPDDQTADSPEAASANP